MTGPHSVSKLLPALLLTLPVLAERIQSPDAPWRTLTTPHYRIHYPDHPSFEPFAREVASQVEGIHKVVSEWVGHEYLGPTDLLIRNPMAAANGMVISILNRPQVQLWTEAPEADSAVAHQSDWIQMLIAHELVHLHHLTRPARKARWYEKMPSPIRLSPISRKCPAWVTEGYATLLEGKLSGSGRPHSAFRATILRQWAREGRLPEYGRLSQGDKLLGGGSAYLLGSAFLAWLEQRVPNKPQILKEFWGRLSSSRYPTFDQAFVACFGEAPAILYQRFKAELVHDALDLERRMDAVGLHEGDLWCQLPHLAQDLSLSPDAKHLLASVLDEQHPGLWIWETAVQPSSQKVREKGEKWDPSHPPEAPEARPTREAKYRLGRVQFSLPSRPHWRKDGQVAYTRREADGEGILHRRTDTWEPFAGSHAAPSIHLLHPQKAGAHWVIRLKDQDWKLPFEPFGALAFDETKKLLYASTEVDGLFNLVRFPFDPLQPQPFGPREVLTRTAGAAYSPAPSPEGKSLYYLQISAWGAQIRKLDLEKPRPQGRWEAALKPFTPGTVLSEPDQASLLPPPGPVPDAHPYQITESHAWTGRIGLLASPSTKSYLLGVGGNDMLGRLNWQVTGAMGLPGTRGLGPRGAAAGLSLRHWSWSPVLQIFSVLERPSAQKDGLPVQGMDRERRGGELALERLWWPKTFSGSFRLALGQEHLQALPGSDLQRRVLQGELRQQALWNQGHLRLGTEVKLQAAQGKSGEEAWNLQMGSLDLLLAYQKADLHLHLQSGRLGGKPGLWDRFSLGGQASDLTPSSLEVTKVWQVALPAHSASGERLRSWRAESALGGLFGGLNVYFEGLALWEPSSPRPDDLRVLGIEAPRTALGDLPLVGEFLRRYVGRAYVAMGIHRPLDGPMKDRTVFSFALTYRY